MQATKAVDITEFYPLSSDPKKEVIIYSDEEKESLKTSAIERLSQLKNV